MFAVFTFVRKAFSMGFLLVLGLFLAACETGGISSGGPSIDTSKPIPVALLVPKGSGHTGMTFSLAAVLLLK